MGGKKNIENLFREEEDNSSKFYWIQIIILNN